MADMKRNKKTGRHASLLRGNNDGNSLVLVVVVMFVVMLLGVAILYSSYTSVLLRSSQRKSEKTFTSAETGMDLIKEGLSEINSDAMAAGYKELLSSFSKNQQTNDQTFIKAYMSEIVKSGKGTSLFPEADTGFKGDVTITKYNIEALNTYLKGKNKEAGSNYTLSAIVDGKPAKDGIGVAHITKNNNVIIRGVRLIYKNGGYEEQVTTDFMFTIPKTDIGYTHKGFDAALDNYNFVADQGVVLYRVGEPGYPMSSNFEGSGYAGNVVVGSRDLVVNDGQELVIGKTRVQDRNQSDATDSFVVKKRGTEEERTSGDIIFATKGSGVKVGKGSTLWANGIQLKSDTSLTSDDDSHINIRNDLEFMTGGEATLKGSYYGFGNGKSFDGSTITNSPSDSSSIIFNAKGKLDISGIDSMTIAGHSFVTESSKNTDKNAGMASSITTRPEQTAYLLPESFMNSLSDESSDDEAYSNPRILDTASEEANDVSKDKALASIDDKKFRVHVDGLSKPLYDYGIVNKTKLKVLTYNVPGNASQCVRYYFLDFGNDQENANAYFKDYFNNNQEQISTYISSYADLIGFDTKGSSIRSSGTTLEGAKNKYTVTGGGTSSSAEADSYNKYYKHLSETLTTLSEGETTPFYHFIDVKLLHKLCGGTRTPNSEAATDANCVTVPLNRHVYFDEQNKKDVIVKAFWGDLAIGGSGTVDGKQFSGGGQNGNGYNAYVVDGDVLVSGNFNGIIMCSGTLYVSVSDRFKIENLGIEALRETDLWGKKKSAPEEQQWEDVTYENWKKD